MKTSATEGSLLHNRTDTMAQELEASRKRVEELQEALLRSEHTVEWLRSTVRGEPTKKTTL